MNAQVNKISMNKKSADTYNTFKGGYDGFNFYDIDGNHSCSYWSYTFMWGHLRFVYGCPNYKIKDNWQTISLHARNLKLFGIDIIPLSTDSKFKHWIFNMANFNWHFAYNKKFPFIKIGFKNIENLYEEL